VNYLELAVPTWLTTHFIVATDHPMTDPAAVAADALRSYNPARPTGRETDQPLPAAGALTLLTTPLLQIHHSPAEESGWNEDLEDIAGPENDVWTVRTVRHHLIITTTEPTVRGPGTVQSARLLARLLAAYSGGIIADPVSNQTVSHSRRPDNEQRRFRLGQDWIGVFITSAHDGATLHANTAGLYRLGLPELHTCGFTSTTGAAVNLLRGLAWQLYDELWKYLQDPPLIESTSRQVKADRLVTPDDVSRYYDAPDSGRDGVHVRLDLVGDPSHPARLTVSPPAEHRRRVGWWWEEIISPVIPSTTEKPSR
jgi:hypothetical protein